MTKEKMSIHKALTELKIINDRIETAIGDTTFCTSCKHYTEKINGKKLPDVREDMKAGYNRITDLINRRAAIKRAVTLSNASTVITIGGIEMTRAEAIEFKKSGIENKQLLLDIMTAQYKSVCNCINDANGEKLAKQADNYVQGFFGAKEKVASDEVIKAREDYIKNNTLDYIEGFNVKDAIEKLQSEIDDFMSEIDSALSVSNAITEIEIEY